jgi:hypothetical protein
MIVSEIFELTLLRILVRYPNDCHIKKGFYYRRDISVATGMLVILDRMASHMVSIWVGSLKDCDMVTTKVPCL